MAHVARSRRTQQSLGKRVRPNGSIAYFSWSFPAFVVSHASNSVPSSAKLGRNVEAKTLERLQRACFHFGVSIVMFFCGIATPQCLHLGIEVAKLVFIEA